MQYWAAPSRAGLAERRPGSEPRRHRHADRILRRSARPLALRRDRSLPGNALSLRCRRRLRTLPDTNARARPGLPAAASLSAADGDARLAFAGYNGGIGVIGQTSNRTGPDETVRYAYWGSGIYSDASSGTDASPRLAGMAQRRRREPVPLRELSIGTRAMSPPSRRPASDSDVCVIGAASAAARSRTSSPAPPRIPP